MSKTAEMVESVYNALRKEVSGQSDRINTLSNYTERSETTGGFDAETFANLPHAADGGLSSGDVGINLIWVSDGRKPGEGVGAGTGVLCYYNAATDTWRRLTDNTDVAI